MVSMLAFDPSSNPSKVYNDFAYKMFEKNKNKGRIGISWGESPGLVVIGGDSCSKGCEFESQNHIYLMDIFHVPICFKMCNVCMKRRK